jgi:hypothetical protein
VGFLAQRQLCGRDAEGDRGVRTDDRRVFTGLFLVGIRRSGMGRRVQARSDGQNEKLVPVRVEACQPPGLLGSIIYIDLVKLDEATARERLLAGAKGPP